MIAGSVIGGFFDSLVMFFTTLYWSIFLAVVGIFVLLIVIYLPRIRVELFRGKASFQSAEDSFRALRLLVIAVPVLVVFLSWQDDPNVLSAMLFDTWLPLVMWMLLAMAIIELGMLPVYRNSRVAGERLKKRAVPKRRR